MGNIIYSILTEKWPYYDVVDQNDVGGKVLNLERPFVDQRYRTSSYIESRLVEIMERMWTHNASERPEIFEVVHYLEETKRAYRSMQNQNRVGLSGWIGSLIDSSECEL